MLIAASLDLTSAWTLRASMASIIAMFSASWRGATIVACIVSIITGCSWMHVSALGSTSSAVLEVVVDYGCVLRALTVCSTGCILSLQSSLFLSARPKRCEDVTHSLEPIAKRKEATREIGGESFGTSAVSSSVTEVCFGVGIFHLAAKAARAREEGQAKRKSWMEHYSRY